MAAKGQFEDSQLQKICSQCIELIKNYEKNDKNWVKINLKYEKKSFKIVQNHWKLFENLTKSVKRTKTWSKIKKKSWKTCKNWPIYEKKELEKVLKIHQKWRKMLKIRRKFNIKEIVKNQQELR